MAHVAESSNAGEVGAEEQDVPDPDRAPSNAATCQRRASTASHAGGFKVGDEPPPLMTRIPTVGNMEYSHGAGGPAHQVMLLDSQASFPESMLLLATMDPEQSFPEAHAPAALTPIASVSRGSSRAGSRATSPSAMRRCSFRSGPAPVDLKGASRSLKSQSGVPCSPIKRAAPQVLNRSDSRSGRRSPSPTNTAMQKHRARSNHASASRPESNSDDAGKSGSEQQSGENGLGTHGMGERLPSKSQPRKKAHSLTSLYQDSIIKFSDLCSASPGEVVKRSGRLVSR